jgi:hypothetical protein
VIQVPGSKIATSEERVADWKILINQGRNEHSLRDELSYHLVFTKNDEEPGCCGESSIPPRGMPAGRNGGAMRYTGGCVQTSKNRAKTGVEDSPLARLVLVRRDVMTGGVARPERRPR